VETTSGRFAQADKSRRRPIPEKRIARIPVTVGEDLLWEPPMGRLLFITASFAIR
jgi:hypothetical protein